MLRKGTDDLQFIVINDLRLDGSVMLFGDGASYGQSDAEAAVLFLRAGFVTAVEAVKQVRQRFIAQRLFHGVFCLENDVLSRLTERYMDIAVLGCVFDGIVAQDTDEPSDSSLVAVEYQFIFRVDDQIFAVELRHADKRIGSITHGV